jgi:hypothetical protein
MRKLGAQHASVATDPQLAQAQAAYLKTAYAALLGRLGTSYDELRLARGASPGVRQAIADRLGIDLGSSRPDHLDGAFMDPGIVTEAWLEQVFGLVDTTRNPLSDGSVVTDSANVLRQWNLQGVNPVRNTDPDGKLNLKVAISGSMISVAALSNSAQVAVGTATLTASAPPFVSVRLVAPPTNPNGGLTGRVLVSTSIPPGGSQITIAAAPSLLAWQARRLCAEWAAEDFPPNAPAATPPIVDLDLLIPTSPISQPPLSGDFKNPNSADAAFSLFQQRQAIVAGWILNLQAKRPDLDAVLSSVLTDSGHPNGYKINDIIALDQSRHQGGDISATLKGLSLTLDAFNYLVKLSVPGSGHRAYNHNDHYRRTADRHRIILAGQARAKTIHQLRRQPRSIRPLHLGGFFLRSASARASASTGGSVFCCVGLVSDIVRVHTSGGTGA